MDLMTWIKLEVNNYVAQTGQNTAPRDSVLDFLLEEVAPERASEIEWLRESLPETLRPVPVAI